MNQINYRRLSRLRQVLRRLMEEISQLRPFFCGTQLMTKGVLYQLKRRCGKPNCYCARGPGRHENWVLSRSVDGKAQLKMVAPEDVLLLKKRTLEYRTFRRARATLRKRVQEMLDAIDAIELLRQADPAE